eukprot:222102-Chlamydomonas_euryale.AAC.1
MDNPFVLHMDVLNADRDMREEKPKQKIQISAASPEGEVHETTQCSAQRLHPPPTTHAHTSTILHFFDMVVENSPRASSGITVSYRDSQMVDASGSTKANIDKDKHFDTHTKCFQVMTGNALAMVLPGKEVPLDRLERL